MIPRPTVVLPPEPPLTDGTITVRGPRPGDAAGLLEEGRDEVTRRWVNVPIPYTEDDARDEASRLVRSWSDPGLPLGLVITDSDDDAYRGLIMLFTDRPGEIAEIAYGAHPAARGRGLVARGLRLVAPWAFATLGVARLEARADPANIASQRTLENAGFTREGLERRSRAVHGVRCDMVCWSLLPEDLAATAAP
jgi:RimJ/RimL family protein N-acetyltransferase